jgi:hypothetical protein
MRTAQKRGRIDYKEIYKACWAFPSVWLLKNLWVGYAKSISGQELNSFKICSQISWSEEEGCHSGFHSIDSFQNHGSPDVGVESKPNPGKLRHPRVPRYIRTALLRLEPLQWNCFYQTLQATIYLEQGG